MNICRKHDCAHNGVCEACNLEERLTESNNDLMATRAMLIDQERALEKAEADLHNARARVEELERQ